jgi:hypothetical protein
MYDGKKIKRKSYAQITEYVNSLVVTNYPIEFTPMLRETRETKESSVER